MNWWCMCVIFFRTDCCFSPDDQLVVTGTSVKKDEGNGKLVFFDRTSFQRVYEIEVTNAVSSAPNSTTTTAPVERWFSNWLWYDMSVTNRSGKVHTVNPRWILMETICMSFFLHVSRLGSNETADIKYFCRIISHFATIPHVFLWLTVLLCYLSRAVEYIFSSSSRRNDWLHLYCIDDSISQMQRKSIGSRGWKKK